MTKPYHILTYIHIKFTLYSTSLGKFQVVFCFVMLKVVGVSILSTILSMLSIKLSSSQMLFIYCSDFLGLQIKAYACLYTFMWMLRKIQSFKTLFKCFSSLVEVLCKIQSNKDIYEKAIATLTNKSDF